MRWVGWIGSILAAGVILVPFAFSASERAGHILAAHCVDMIKDYVGDIRDIKVTAWPFRAARTSDEKKVREVHGRYIDGMSNAGFPVSLYAPAVYVEYRQGAVGQRVDASCNYVAVSSSDGPPVEVTLVDVIARTEILKGPYRVPHAKKKVAYSSIGNRLLSPIQWFRYRASIARQI